MSAKRSDVEMVAVRRGAPLLVLGHGAGGSRRQESLVRLSEALAAAGVGTLRFDFPYVAAGRKIPDPMPRLEASYREALALARSRKPSLLLAGGRSLGGRVATHLAAEGEALDGLVLLGYPLHPAGKPEKRRVGHLPRIGCPMLFVSGTRDELAPRRVLAREVAKLRGATIQWIEEADHGLDVPRRRGDRASISREVAGFVLEFLAAMPAR